MKAILARGVMTSAAAALTFASATVFAGDITGAGATFPYPLYAKWASEYKKTTNVGMNYQSIGSGGGIKQIKAKTVDFGASDKPLTPKELDEAGLFQFPTVMGGVVPVINVTGVATGKLKLTPEVLAEIFLGKVSKWNDPKITALNAGVPLPDLAINVIHRADGSGTTFIFTNYLSKVSSDWKGQVGEEASVKWPVGIGGKGNEGVANFVKQTPGSIGYVEYAYALQNKMNLTQLRNKDGQFVAPSEESFKAAAAHADWDKAPGFYEILTNEPGKASWPITGATFILMHKHQDKPDTARDVVKFFDWAYANGDKTALDMDYIPMPDAVVKLVRQSWKANLKDAAGKPLL
ncbi:MAG: phosphate ABC transporter substrate-binding protein PstS [Chitinivorax sp.]